MIKLYLIFFQIAMKQLEIYRKTGQSINVTIFLGSLTFTSVNAVYTACYKIINKNYCPSLLHNVNSLLRNRRQVTRHNNEYYILFRFVNKQLPS